MKIKLEKLKSAFAVCDAVVAVAALESSQHVRLKRTDSELSLALTGISFAESRVAVAEPGKWTAHVDRRALKAFLATARKDEVEVFVDKSGAILMKAGQRLEIPARAVVAGYESWKPVGEYDLSPELKAAVGVAVKYLPSAAGAESVEAVNFVKGYGVVATDTIFLAAYLSPSIKQSFFLPAAVAQFLASSGGKLATDDRGAGAVTPDGHVFQPRSADLDNYPLDMCKTSLAIALKSPTVAEASAEDLLEVIQTASQFLVDKAEDAKVEPAAKGISFTVDLGAGKFQKTVPAKLVNGMAAAVWPIRRLAPWLERAAACQARVEIAKTANATCLRYLDGKIRSALVFADL
jgi:hypothetical protein